MRANPRYAPTPASTRALRIVLAALAVGVIGLTTWYVSWSATEQVRREGNRLLVERDVQLDHLAERIEAKIEQDDANAAQSRECLVQVLVAVQQALNGVDVPAAVPPVCSRYLP